MPSSATPTERIPVSVYILAAGIFAMVTSEFTTAGLMPQLAEGLGVRIDQIGYLVTIFALSMAVDGPLLTLALIRLPPKSALLIIFGIFLIGNVLAAVSTGYGLMVLSRIISGAAAQAFIGISVSVAAQLVGPWMRGRASAVVMSGVMLGTLLGLPLSTFVGGQFGWRWAFWTISVLTVLATALTIAVVRNPAPPDHTVSTGTGPAANASEFAMFRRPQLLLALASSMLIIGATFSAFSFFTPILTEITGFSETTVPLLLLVYGAMTVIGNVLVGRFADQHTITTLLVGTGLNIVFLTGFLIFTDLPAPAVVFMFGIGLVGVTMNPAMAVRVQRTGGTRPLVNTVHSSFISLGIMLGSAIGSALIPGYGLRAPLVLGIVMGALAIVVILPALASPYLRGKTAPPETREALEPDRTDVSAH